MVPPTFLPLQISLVNGRDLRPWLGWQNLKNALECDMEHMRVKELYLNILDSEDFLEFLMQSKEGDGWKRRRQVD